MSQDETTPAAQRRRLSLQAAGHDLVERLDSDRIAKPSTHVEVAFYQAAQTHADLRPFLPEFGGLLDRSGEPCIILEDLTRGLDECSVADVKLGLRLYDGRATAEKRARMIAQARRTTTGVAGVRLCGAKIWDGARQTHRELGRELGRALTAAELTATLGDFFRAQPPAPPPLIAALAKQAEALWHVLAQKQLRLVSSSVLLVYGRGSDGSPVGRLRMIDFAHSDWLGDGAAALTPGLHLDAAFPHVARGPGSPLALLQDPNLHPDPGYEPDAGHPGGPASPGPGPDWGYLFGLRNLVLALRHIAVDTNAQNAAGNSA